jgi:hypothetical protein
LRFPDAHLAVRGAERASRRRPKDCVKPPALTAVFRIISLLLALWEKMGCFRRFRCVTSPVMCISPLQSLKTRGRDKGHQQWSMRTPTQRSQQRGTKTGIKRVCCAGYVLPPLVHRCCCTFPSLPPHHPQSNTFFSLVNYSVLPPPAPSPRPAPPHHRRNPMDMFSCAVKCGWCMKYEEPPFVHGAVPLSGRCHRTNPCQTSFLAWLIIPSYPPPPPKKKTPPDV